MSEKKYLSLDTSSLYRCNQKFYDKFLEKYGLGYTHMLLLTQIYENEGISMNELAVAGSFDKGTITKSIQKLEQLGYVTVVNSEVDKRAKLLNSTDKAQQIMPALYVQQQSWFNYITGELSEEEKQQYLSITSKLLSKARAYSETHIDNDGVRIYGLQKLTLLDYPGHMAATVFTGGCNFKCPFCHNRSLVFLEEADQEIDPNDVIDFLEKRQGILDGVCITGGEPLLHPGIKGFIKHIKSLGLNVKLDTNGSNSSLLRELVQEKLVDYVALDIKNAKDKYGKTIGVENFDLSEVEKSVKYLLEDHVDYEFRTTVVSQFHEVSDFEEIGKWIKGAKRYYLQNFEDHGNCISAGLNAMEIEKLVACRELAQKYVKEVNLRGVKE